ncbi:glycosyltransferase family 2 protein [Microbacterium sp. NPDC091382]|uniref:glycosyltransferase family 2 protein n=1 Tax=Microbacterium sp. NPDC091382 TaxID=3364210 RepID=UPI0038084BB8
MTARGPRPTAGSVTVVIPVKDDADGLRRCLRALALQTRKPDEIIVVDNGSADDSARVGRENGTRVVSCDHPGIPAAAAAGYDSAMGDLILRLDADCIPASTWIEVMSEHARARPEVDVFVGAARFIDGPRLLRSPLAVAYLGAYAAVLTPTLGHLPLFGSNLAMRRPAWVRVSATVHRSDPEIHDDLDLSFHLGKEHRIRFVPSAMGISMRPFASRSAFRRRVLRGIRTVVRHWPEEFAPIRWARSARRLVTRGAGARASA